MGRTTSIAIVRRSRRSSRNSFTIIAHTEDDRTRGAPRQQRPTRSVRARAGHAALPCRGIGDTSGPLRGERTMASQTVKAQLELLRSVPLFSLTPQKQLRAIAEQCRSRQGRAGTRLTQQGKNGREFFLVVSGTALRVVDGREIRKFAPGSFFGELGLLNGHPRAATIVADTPMELLVLDRRDFNALLRSAPDVAIGLLSSLATRLPQA